VRVFRRLALCALFPLTVSPVVGAPPAAGAYHFALAKMLAAEGSFREATAEFRRAAELLPEDAYVRLELAELLFRLAQISPSPQRGERLGEAAVEVEAARRLAPESSDVLRTAGQIHMARAEQDPAALAQARSAWEALRRLDPGDAPPMIGLGQLYMAQGEPARAAEVFADLLRRRQDDATVAALLVDALLKAGRGEEAEATLRESVAAHPGALDLRLQLAELLAGRGDHRGAVAVLAAAPPPVLQQLEVRRRLAFALYQAGDPEAALIQVESVLAESADDFGGRFLRALVLVALARNDEAAAELRDLNRRSPQAVEVALALARVERRLGDTEGAARLLESLAARLEGADSHDEAARVRLQLGATLAEAGEWQRVLEAIGPARERSPEEWRDDLTVLAIEALSALGRGEEALAALEARAAEPGADRRLLAGRRAQILHRLGRVAEAREVLRRLAAQGEDGRLTAAETFQQLELWAEAIAVLERRQPGAAAPTPDQGARGDFLLGAAYERSGRREEAVRVFRGLLEREPQNAPALNYLGYMLAERGESLAEALELVRRAVALDPDNGAYLDSLGWAHYQRGEFDEARRYLERAAGLVPDDATVVEHLGDLYFALGEVERARDLYRRALDLNGENDAELRRKLARLDDGS
jgi:tetratricopeptide (TPR) repeat protein